MKQTVIATCGKGQNHDDEYGGELGEHIVYESSKIFFMQ